MAQEIEVAVSAEPVAKPQKRVRLSVGIAPVFWLVAALALGLYAWSVPRSNQAHQLEQSIVGLQEESAELDAAIAQTTAELDKATAANAAERLNQRQLGKDLAASERKIKSLQRDVHRLNRDIATAKQQQQTAISAPAPSVPPLNCHAVYLDTNGDGTVDKVELVCD